MHTTHVLQGLHPFSRRQIKCPCRLWQTKSVFHFSQNFRVIP